MMTENYVEMQEEGKEPSIVDDFMYGTNVMQSHIYVRMGFLRKVYGLLTIQILLTSIVGSLFMFIPDVKGFIMVNSWMLTVSMLSTLFILLALMIKRRESPMNLYLLFGFTICEAVSIGFLVALSDKTAVLQAFLITLVITVGLTLFTLQSKRDFKSLGGFLFFMLWGLIAVGLVHLFIPTTGVELGLAFVGAIVFSLFIVYDTHLLMKQLSPEEYILATINLYLDIINLFVHILRILNAVKRN